MRRATLTTALVAVAIAAAPAQAAASQRPPGQQADRTGAAASLPTPAQVRARTGRFLARHATAAARRGPDSGGATPTPAPAPGAVLPANRVVALYGAPQLTKTIVGMKSPRGATRRLVRQAEAYTDEGLRPVIGEIDLIAVIATAGAGVDGKYRTRQDETVIATYLQYARKVGARLMLDIQPGRSPLAAELRALRPWVLQPDVDVAIDPEWNVGRRGVPGRTPGSVTAKEVNKVSLRLQQTIEGAGLPPKLLVVHQFRRGSVRGRGQLVSRPGVETVLNFDGIGSPGAKASGYASLSVPELFDGFSLFYRRDAPLMAPSAVLGLDPEPDFLLYQ